MHTISFYKNLLELQETYPDHYKMSGFCKIIHTEPAAKTYKGPVIVKFGRYVANSESYFNEDLGVTLISKNQYTHVF